jgi:hypothetical protein
MNKPKTYPICIRISERCLRARRYLQKMEVNPDYYMREGGEKAVINKALEFFYEKEERKQFKNAPPLLFGSKHEPKKQLTYQS